MQNNEIVNPPHPGKLELIEEVGRTLRRPWRFVDLGGLWAVHGAYAFHALTRTGCIGGTMVDTHPTRTFLDALKDEPRLEFIQGNFGDTEVFKRLPDFDVVFLFDTLLHQVRPDWDEILRMYAAKASQILIFNQQYTGEKTVRLLELGEEAYFRNVPHDPKHPTYSQLFRRLDEPHPVHGRPWRDVHHIWQWGITDTDLINTLEALGFHPVFSRNWGQVHQLEYFENHAFLFSRTRESSDVASHEKTEPIATESPPLTHAHAPAPFQLPPVSEVRFTADLSGQSAAETLSLLRNFRRVLGPGAQLILTPPVEMAEHRSLLEHARYAGLDSAPQASENLVLQARDRLIPPGTNPLVTLAIPAFKPAFFAECLDSAFAQTYPNLHILVCDDSGADHLRQIAAERTPPGVNLEWISNPENIGGRANFAQCIERAKGTFIKFLCDDDKLAPNCIERMVDAFRPDPSVTLAFSRRARIDSAGNPLPEDHHTEMLSDTDCIFQGDALAGAVIALQANFIGEPTTVMFRKADLQWIQPHYASFNGHDDIRVVGDIAAWHNLLSQGEAAYIAEALSSFRIHPGQNQAQAKIRELIGTSWSKLEQGSRALGFLQVVHGPIPHRAPGTATWLIDANSPLNRRLAAAADHDRNPDSAQSVARTIIRLADSAIELAADPEAESPATSDRTGYEQAAAKMAAGHTDAAIAELIALAEADSDVWEVYADLAEFALRQNDREAALALQHTAVAKSPTPGKASLGLAALQTDAGQYEQALATISPYLRAHPKDGAALALVRHILGLSAELSPVAWARLSTDMQYELTKMSAQFKDALEALTAIRERASALLPAQETNRTEVAISASGSATAQPDDRR